MHSNKHKRQERQIIFPQGNHKGEKPATSSEIESAPKSKTRKHKDDLLIAEVSLLSQQLLSLTHAAPMSECVCDK